MKNKEEIESELNIAEGELQNMQSAAKRFDMPKDQTMASKEGEIKALKWVLGRD